MKNILKSTLAVFALLTLLGSCKNYDDDIDALDKRVSALEEWQSTVNTNITSLQTIVAALQTKDYVTSVTALTDGTGYQIKFQNSGTITIRNGKDGVTPVIGVKKDADGNYYWTVDTGSGATWLTDANGSKIRTTGDNGKDATAPQVRINSDTNFWEISTDGGATWASTGVKATGATGATGETGATGATGEKGNSVFAANGVTVGTESVTFELANKGGTFTVPLYQAMKITGGTSKDSINIFTSGTPQTLTVTLPSGLAEADYTSILAEAKSVSGTGIDLQTRSAATATAWGVTITKPDFTASPATATLTVTPPTAISADNKTALLTVTLAKTDGAVVTAARTLDLGIFTTYNQVGSGTETDPFLLYNATQLASLATTVNAGTDMSGKYFKMMDNIDLSSVCGDGTNGAVNASWTPIGKSNNSSGGAPQFAGIFDGNGYSVTRLYINAPSDDYKGLFGVITSTSVIKNLSVSGKVTGRFVVGGIVGFNYGGIISGCSSSVEVKGDLYVGGIAGENNSGSITACYNTGNVGGDNSSYVGGIAGYDYFGSITACYNTGTVTGSNFVGGIAGKNNSGSITACYNTGTVTGSGNYVGGIAGENHSGSITACYNTGTVTGSNSFVGGIAGNNDSGSIAAACYFLSGSATNGVGDGTSAGVSSVASITDLNGAVLTLNGAITTWNTGNPTNLCNFQFKASTTPATDVPTLASGAPTVP